MTPYELVPPQIKVTIVPTVHSMQFKTTILTQQSSLVTCALHHNQPLDSVLNTKQYFYNFLPLDFYLTIHLLTDFTITLEIVPGTHLNIR